MGAWSHLPLGNDDAADWAAGLEGTTDLAPIAAALDAALEEEEYLEAPEACEAIAAVEVLAKLLGKGTQNDGDAHGVDAWVQSVSIQPDAVLLEKARKVLARVAGEDSELRELWEESDPTEWLASLQALQEALKS